MYPVSRDARMVDIKFCGTTREEDARLAAALGARYVGVIFARSRRRVNVEQAARIVGVLDGRDVSAVGVFDQEPDEILGILRRVRLSVVQLHGASDPARIAAVRQGFDGLVWAVSPVLGGEVSGDLAALFRLADGVLLDAAPRDGEARGGSGRTFDWAAAATSVAAAQAGGKARLIVAGGLQPANVRDAIECLSPDVVDVSSGVETAPGIKDPRLMRAFVDAARNGASR